eukprot:15451459-Alexandrium_andersonii.AAC.1
MLPSTARAQEGAQNGAPKLLGGACCALVHADSEPANEGGDRGGPRRETAKVASFDLQPSDS